MENPNLRPEDEMLSPEDTQNTPAVPNDTDAPEDDSRLSAAEDTTCCDAAQPADSTPAQENADAQTPAESGCADTATAQDTPNAPHAQMPGQGYPYPYPQQPAGYPVYHGYPGNPYGQQNTAGSYPPPPHYTYPPRYGYMPQQPKPPRRRKNHTAIVATLILLGITAALFLADSVIGTVYSGVPHKRPAPSEVPSFAIEELPEDLDGGLSTEEIARAVGPSVVCINIYEPHSIAIAGSGSGIILNSDGFIVTNAHVVEGSSAVKVVLADGRELDAWIVGADARTDLAVVKVTADDLVPAAFGNSDTLHVGERAIAIGNAAGQFSGTVTQGIISGLDREVRMQSGERIVRMNLIQTDASINPGNSGGALVNRFGQVIGINSVKMTSTKFEGLGFAIPIADARPVVEDLIAYGYVKDRASLGVVIIGLNPALAAENDVPSQGLFISAIEDYCDLINYDIAVGDIILTADGETMKTPDDLLEILEKHKPGETVKLEIQKHGSGTVVTIDALLVESRSN